jgi:hypothetical protein
MAKGAGKAMRARGRGDFTDYLRELAKNGYMIESSNSSHWKIYLRCGKAKADHYGGVHCKECTFICGTSASPSDVRALINLKKQIERGGLKHETELLPSPGRPARRHRDTVQVRADRGEAPA